MCFTSTFPDRRSCRGGASYRLCWINNSGCGPAADLHVNINSQRPTCQFRHISILNQKRGGVSHSGVYRLNRVDVSALDLQRRVSGCNTGSCQMIKTKSLAWGHLLVTSQVPAEPWSVVAEVGLINSGADLHLWRTELRVWPSERAFWRTYATTSSITSSSVSLEQERTTRWGRRWPH